MDGSISQVQYLSYQWESVDDILSALVDVLWPISLCCGPFLADHAHNGSVTVLSQEFLSSPRGHKGIGAWTGVDSSMDWERRRSSGKKSVLDVLLDLLQQRVPVVDLALTCKVELGHIKERHRKF